MSDNQEIRRVCAVLESISLRFPPESEEALAIRNAASAFIIVQQNEKLKASYAKYLQAAGGVLSESMKDDLRRHGIDPDGFDEE